MGRGWKNFKVHAIKAYIAIEWDIKADSGEGSERKEESYKALTFIENT